jgi:hypothetical protein
MPTGYTAGIENDISFEDYLLSCARAFGACVHQRDEATAVKPKLQTIDNQAYEEMILSAEAELGALRTMTREQREEYGQELKDQRIASAQKYFNEKVLLKNKYDAMMVKVQVWNPPTPDHQGLKQFMIDQINDSIRFDCGTDYWLEQLTIASNANPIKLVDEEIAMHERTIARYEEEWAKNGRRVEESNRWITALYDSLGIEYDAAD